MRPSVSGISPSRAVPLSFKATVTGSDPWYSHPMEPKWLPAPMTKRSAFGMSPRGIVHLLCSVIPALYVLSHFPRTTLEWHQVHMTGLFEFGILFWVAALLF